MCRHSPPTSGRFVHFCRRQRLPITPIAEHSWSSTQAAPSLSGKPHRPAMSRAPLRRQVSGGRQCPDCQQSAAEPPGCPANSKLSRPSHTNELWATGRRVPVVVHTGFSCTARGSASPFNARQAPRAVPIQVKRARVANPAWFATDEPSYADWTSGTHADEARAAFCTLIAGAGLVFVQSGRAPQVDASGAEARLWIAFQRGVCSRALFADCPVACTLSIAGRIVRVADAADTLREGVPSAPETASGSIAGAAHLNPCLEKQQRIAIRRERVRFTRLELSLQASPRNLGTKAEALLHDADLRGLRANLKAACQFRELPIGIPGNATPIEPMHPFATI